MDLDASRTALLVMDLQSGLLEQLPGADAVLGTAQRVLAGARERGIQVVYVRVGLDDADIAALTPHSRFSATYAQRGDLIHADNPATAIHPAVAPVEGDIVVRKSRVGAFSTTDLHEQLQAKGIDTIVLAGISTSGVVLSTVRDASDKDYRILVLSDACVDPQEDVGAFLLERVIPRMAEVLTIAELF